MEIYKYEYYGISVEFCGVFNVSILSTDNYKNIETIDNTRDFIGDRITMISVFDNGDSCDFSFYKMSNDHNHTLLLSTKKIIPEALKIYNDAVKVYGDYIEKRSIISDIWDHYKNLVK